MRIGVLALQGDFELHRRRLESLGATPTLIKGTRDLQQPVEGLVLPGGESSTMLKLLDSHLEESLLELITDGIPVLSTCAGTILLAGSVSNPAQRSLGLLDIEVRRNAYGRQKDSFITRTLDWTEEAESFARSLGVARLPNLEAIFIRAPRITSPGSSEILLRAGDDPVLVRQKNILAATFHPEASDRCSIIHELFLSLATVWVDGASKRLEASG